MGRDNNRIRVINLMDRCARLILSCGLALIAGCALVVISMEAYQWHAAKVLDRKLAAPVHAAAASSRQSLHRPGEVLARLEIPRLGLSQIILEGTSDSTLRRGLGHIEDTAFPGELGNVGVAGHRDTFFRAVRNVLKGDEIIVTAPSGKITYIVDSMKVTTPEDTGGLDPTPAPSLTLVTCFPFNFVGHAPKRFVVRATRVVDYGGRPMMRAALFQQPPQPSPGDLTIRSYVNQVMLYATVQDSRGKFVSGLAKDNFHLYEDRNASQISYFQDSDIPVAVGIVVDSSASMAPKRADVNAGALAFASVSNPGDEIFVVNFSEKVSFGLPPEIPFTNKPDELRAALSATTIPGRTALYDALVASVEHIRKSTLQKRILLLVSDGGDNVSRHNLSEVLGRVDQSGVIIYTIGLFAESDDDRNPGALNKMARASGGIAFLPNGLREVVETCRSVAKDVRNQYAIGYSPQGGIEDSRYHTLRLEAVDNRHRKLRVRTRAGYYGPDHFQQDR
jgi:Ca-activated chloride channel homolog